MTPPVATGTGHPTAAASLGPIGHPITGIDAELVPDLVASHAEASTVWNGDR